MARVTVELPSLLAGLIEGRARVELEAATLRGALDELVRLHPLLAGHLFDERGEFRRHVLCFHNGTNTRWLEDLERPLAEGDTVRVMQAVSGG